MKVILEEVYKANKLLQAVNSKQLGDLEVMYNGKPVTISKDNSDWWKFVGLNSADFLTTVPVELWESKLNIGKCND